MKKLFTKLFPIWSALFLVIGCFGVYEIGYEKGRSEFVPLPDTIRVSDTVFVPSQVIPADTVLVPFPVRVPVPLPGTTDTLFVSDTVFFSQPQFVQSFKKEYTFSAGSVSVTTDVLGPSYTTITSQSVSLHSLKIPEPRVITEYPKVDLQAFADLQVPLMSIPASFSVGLSVPFRILSPNLTFFLAPELGVRVSDRSGAFVGIRFSSTFK